jgi:tetratricopeptide (TPR) repeat protein
VYVLVEVGDPRARDTSLRAGDKVGHYTVVERIGVGGFGEVYRAHHEKIGRDVAVKLLHEKYSSDAAAIARFVAEARAVNRISHPNIIEVYDFGELADGRSYFVMELLRGRTLREIMGDRPMPLAEALPLLREIAAALTAAHAEGIAHRDLKPDNVFVLPNGRVKLIDFGLAKLVRGDGEASAESGTIAGTPLYMSPEQLRGSFVDTRTDAYSFGVLVYQMLAGQPPFTGPDALSIALQHINDPPPAPSAMRIDLCTVDSPVLALLSKDPSKRPSLLDAIAQFEPRNSSTLADAITQPALPLHERQPTTRPRHWLTIALASVVVTAIIIVGLMWFRGTSAAIGTTISVTAHPARAADDGWFAAPVARMLGDRLMRHGRRAYTIVPNGFGSTQIAVTYQLANSQWLTIAKIGDLELGTGQGDSISTALDQLALLLAPMLDDGRPPARPTAHEQEEMSRIGAPDVVAYRRLVALRDDFDRSWHANSVPVLEGLRELMRDYPVWLYPCLQHALIDGQGGAASKSTLLECRKRDRAPALPSAILDAMQASSVEDTQRILRAVRDSRRDRLAQNLLAPAAIYTGDLDEAALIDRERAVAHPTLQYGVNLLFSLRRAGRDSEAEAFIRQWAADWPESEHSLVELIALDVRTNHHDAAQVHLARRRALLGESTFALASLFDVYLLLGDLHGAHRIVDRMLGEEGLTRARGRLRLGMLAIIEGRFASAAETLGRARTEHIPFGMGGELTQVLTTHRAIAPLTGTSDDQKRLLDVTIEAFHFDAAVAAALRYERELRRTPGTCPEMETSLAPLVDDALRTTARRRMLRVGNAAGCFTCKEVVTAGMSADEGNSDSLLAFALCAEDSGDLDLARRAIERATLPTTLQVEPSPYHWTLAELRLARILAKQGQTEPARALYKKFIDRWSKADRIVPEIAAAKAELSTLER